MVEVKVTGASIGSLLAGITTAILNGVIADSSILGTLPSWSQFIILTVSIPIITWLGGYVTPSTTSSTSDAYTTVNRAS